MSTSPPPPHPTMCHPSGSGHESPTSPWEGMWIGGQTSLKMAVKRAVAEPFVLFRHPLESARRRIHPAVKPIARAHYLRYDAPRLASTQRQQQADPSPPQTKAMLGIRNAMVTWIAGQDCNDRCGRTKESNSNPKTPGQYQQGYALAALFSRTSPVAKEAAEVLTSTMRQGLLLRNTHPKAGKDRTNNSKHGFNTTWHGPGGSGWRRSPRDTFTFYRESPGENGPNRPLKCGRRNRTLTL